MSMYAQYRLVWRPATIPQLLPLFWAVVWPVLMVSDSSPAGPAPRDAAWLAAVGIPGALAIVLSISRADLCHSLTGFTLPGVQRKLWVANVGSAAVAAAGLGALMATIGGTLAGVAAASLALASFALGTALLDGAVHPAQRLLLLTSAALAVWKSAVIGEFVVGQPFVAAVLAAAALGVLRTLFSRGTMRRRAFLPGITGTESARTTAIYWSTRKQKPDTERWTMPLATDRIAPHLAGVIYPAAGGVWKLARIHLFQAAFAVVATRLLGDPFFLAFIAGMQMVVHAVGGQYHLVGPLSRVMRARLAWSGALLNVALFAALILVLWPLRTVIPAGAWTGVERPGDIVVVLGSIIALAPVAQWAPIRGGLARVRGAEITRPGPWIAVLLYILGVRGLGELAILLAGPGIDSLTVLAPVAVAMQALFRVAIERHYRTADLVVR